MKIPKLAIHLEGVESMCSSGLKNREKSYFGFMTTNMQIAKIILETILFEAYTIRTCLNKTRHS
jgi:hypothetical protein